MVYDRIECLGEWASRFFQVTHFAVQTHPLLPLSISHNWTNQRWVMCLWRRLSAFTKKSVIHVNPHFFPCRQKTQVILIEVWKSQFVSLFFVSSHYLLPLPETHISTECALSYTHTLQISSIRLVSNAEDIQTGLWEMEALTTFCCSFFLLPHKLRTFGNKRSQFLNYRGKSGI